MSAQDTADICASVQMMALSGSLNAVILSSPTHFKTLSIRTMFKDHFDNRRMRTLHNPINRSYVLTPACKRTKMPQYVLSMATISVGLVFCLKNKLGDTSLSTNPFHKFKTSISIYIPIQIAKARFGECKNRQRTTETEYRTRYAQRRSKQQDTKHSYKLSGRTILEHERTLCIAVSAAP